MLDEVLTPEQRRARLITALGGASVGHAWAPHPRYPTRCAKCPSRSPFYEDRASHLYVIQEAP